MFKLLFPKVKDRILCKPCLLNQSEVNPSLRNVKKQNLYTLELPSVGDKPKLASDLLKPMMPEIR